MNKFRVLTGLNAGAEMDLEGRAYVIGSSDRACDIVLADTAVAPRVCSVHCTGPRNARVEVYAGQAIDANEVALAMGTHSLELPAHLRLPNTDILIAAGHAQAVPPPELATASPSKPRGQSALRLSGAAAVACVVAAYMAFSEGATGGHQAQAHDVAHARRVLERLDYGELQLQATPGGGISVTGYLRRADDLRTIKDGLRGIVPSDRLSLRLSQRGSATLFDGTAKAAAVTSKALGAGVLLVDGPASAGTPSANLAAHQPAPITLRLRSWQAGEAGYIEAASGVRYTIGSAMPGGFILMAIEADSITVRRDTQVLQLALRESGG